MPPTASPMSAAAAERDEQRREAAHDRVGQAEVAVPVGADERDVVADVDHERRQQLGPGGGTGQADDARSGSATTPAITWISAVSSDLSPPDLMSAFHEACSSAPNSTAGDDRPGQRHAVAGVAGAGRRGQCGTISVAATAAWRREAQAGGFSGPQAPCFEARMRVCVSAPADSRIG